MHGNSNTKKNSNIKFENLCILYFCYHSAENWANMNMKLNVAVSFAEYVESDDSLLACAEQEIE